MKRILPLVLALCMLLTGCMSLDVDVTVNSDGTVDVSYFTGMTVDAYNQAVQEGMEIPFDTGITEVHNGTTYVGERSTETYATPEDLSNENVYLWGENGSYTLVIENQPEDMETGELPDEYSAELEEYMKDLYIQVTFNFPANVTQTSGPSDGVAINGSILTLDQTKMVEGTYVFYAGSTGRFTDVATDAWYYEAVSALGAGRLVNGYGDGTFGPEDGITLAAICQILANVDSAESGPFATGGYWAERAIAYCINKGYIEPREELTPAVYDVLATREEVVSAIARAYAGFNTNGPAHIRWRGGDTIIKDVEEFKRLGKVIFDHTGYSIYFIPNPEDNIDIDTLTKTYFPDVNNGCVVAIKYNYDGTITDVSGKYYASKQDTPRRLISSMFALDHVPEISVQTAIEDGFFETYKFAEPGYWDADDVSIPDITNIDTRYLSDILTAYDCGLCSGVDEVGTFLPKANITRAEVCQLFYNIHWIRSGVS